MPKELPKSNVRFAKPVQMSPEQRAIYNARRLDWMKRLQPISDAMAESQRITAADLAVTVDYGSSGNPYVYERSPYAR